MDIETIDLTGSGDNTLMLTAQSVRDVSDSSDTLVVKGNTGDRVEGLSDGWVDAGMKDGMHAFTKQGVELLIDTTIVTNPPFIPSVIDLSSLDGHDGFRLDGAAAYDFSGRSVSGAGDINGDGFDDVLIGASESDANGFDSGSSYVVFGKASGFAAHIDLSTLDGTNGFSLDGIHPDDSVGISVSDAGDVNGDGLDDVIVSGDGSSYVMFGKASGFDAQIDVSSMDGQNGFRLVGGNINNVLGYSVSNAGDVNGDGFNDVMVDGLGELAFVVFGRASGFDATIDISTLDGSNGFRLKGEHYSSLNAVSAAGDINGDGLGDVIVGSEFVFLDDDGSGSSYVVFGQTTGFDAQIDLTALDGSNGFRLDGASGDYSGSSVSDAGDVNGDGFGDGFEDVIVSAPWADPNGEDSGSSYVIFGRSNFQSDQTIRGTPGDDNLTGTTGNDRFEAGDGNDSMTGLGGADTFLAGKGDDVLKVTDLDFQLANGEDGQDTLELTGNGFDLNLADFRDRINQIETIDLTGSGDNTLTFSLTDFLDVADSADTSFDSLTVKGNKGDRVQVLDGNWTDGGTDQNYRIFMHSGATLRVDRSVDIDIVIERGVFDLGTLDGNNGFRLDGEALSGVPGGSVGRSVSNAGDINGDGFDDVIIGASQDYSTSGPGLGFGYVVLGKATGFDAQMDLSELDGSNGFRMGGVEKYDHLGASVSSAGDVNGDDFDDLMVNSAKATYVVFGQAGGFDAQIDLSALDGRNGFRMDTGTSYNYYGDSVSSAGDINGDGFDDMIIGDPDTGSIDDFSGASYVVFGRASTFDAHMDLSNLDGRNGFRLDGVTKYDRLGYSVSGAGDINDDGFDDVIVGARGAGSSAKNTGSSYVIFGQTSGFDARMTVSDLDGRNGFRLDSVNVFDGLGGSVSGAGDVNGDGLDDLIVSGSLLDSNGEILVSSYVMFGRASGFGAQIDLLSLDGSNGFRLDGAGKSVSGAGDVNGDGFDDVIIGAPTSGPHPGSGSSYVVLGKTSGFDAVLHVDDLDGNNGFRLDGVSNFEGSGSSVSGAGDVNGDGFDDLLVGAPGAGLIGDGAGASYVIFGSRDFGSGGGGGGELPEIKGTDDNDTLKGSEIAEHFIAGDGNDNLLGRGGADIFDAGAGDDAIRIGDLTFASIDGGDGNDALHLAGADLNLDLTTLGDRIHSVETICLYGRGDNTLTLSADSLLNLSDSTNTLKVHGNSGDHIAVQGTDWVDDGSHGFYHTYTHDDAVLLVGTNVIVEFV